MTAEIKLGIIGLGRFAQLHRMCLTQLEGVRVQAVCDIRPEAAEEAAREFGCRAYTDVAEMLHNEKLDAIDVLTPEEYHYDAVMAGLAAGCHVFVEKPLATDVVKAEEMIRTAEESGRLLMVGHVTRFDPRYIRMKQAIEAGEIGKLRSIYARRSDGRQYFSIYKRTPTIYVLGIHDIDQILWYAGDMPVEVYAKAASSDEGEDMVWAMLTFKDGLVAVIESNWMTPKAWPAPQDQATQVIGDKGVLRMQNPDSAFSVCTEERYDIPFMYALRDVYGKLEGPLLSELSHFVNAVRAGDRTSAILPSRDALSVVRVADAIVRSCRDGAPVRLND